MTKNEITWIIIVANSGNRNNSIRVATALAAALGSRYALPATVLSTSSTLTHIGLGRLPVLEATPSGLLTTVRAAVSAKLTVVVVPDHGPDGHDYAAFSEIVDDVDSPRLQYLGVALVGSSQLLRKLSSGFRPLTS